MSQSLRNIIQIAVRSASDKPASEQVRILNDCHACAGSAQLKLELESLSKLICDADRKLLRFEASPYEDQI